MTSVSEQINIKDRFPGALLGLAVGDALGTTLEFKSPGSFKPLVDMIGGGPFKLKPGYWTDDTSMALCLAESLMEQKGFDPVDQLKRYVRWFREGHNSSTGRCFDIGTTTRNALETFEGTGESYCGPTSPRTAGNGSIMRLAPVPLFYFNDPFTAMEKSGESSRTTHGALQAIDACRYMGGLMTGILNGVSKEEILADRFSPVPGYWEKDPPCWEIDEIAFGSFKHRNPPDIKGSGYVVRTLEAALWAFYKTDNFRDGVLMTVNLGDDADTTGAVFGQIAGAYYGVQGIPEEWIEKLAYRELLESMAEGLYQISSEHNLPLSRQ